MAQITGATTTSNVLSNQLANDFGRNISLLEPSADPLTLFTRYASTRRTVNRQFSWFEETSKQRFFTQSGGATSSATSIAVNSGQGAGFQQWDQVLVTRTGEQFRVDGVSGDTLTVTRGIGSTAATINAGDELLLVGQAQPENDTSKPARSDLPSQLTNYTQILRTPLEISGSLQASGFQLSPDEWGRQQRNKGIEHAKDIEYTGLFGRKSSTTPGSTEDRTTGGFLSFIATNQTDAGGDLSEAEFNAFMAQVSRYSTGRLLALGSATAVSALNKFPASKQQTRNDETTYGMNVTSFTNPFGSSLNVVYHRLLEGTKYGGYMLVIDMSQVSYRFLGNDQMSRDTHMRQNIQPPDQDGRKDELLTECGWEVGEEKRHGVLTGITS